MWEDEEVSEREKNNLRFNAFTKQHYCFFLFRDLWFGFEESFGPECVDRLGGVSLFICTVTAPHRSSTPTMLL